MVILFVPTLFSHIGRFQFPQAMGVHRTRLPDVHRLSGSRKYRIGPAERSRRPIQTAVGAADGHRARSGRSATVGKVCTYIIYI